VPIANLHNGGEFQKYVNVVTNAKNNPSFRLSISGSYHPLIELDPSGNLTLSSTKGKDTGAIITIKTAEKNFKITDIQFKDNGKELDFKANVPINFSMLPVDTVKPVKDTAKAKKTPPKAKPEVVPPLIFAYKVKVSYVPCSKTDIYGEFILKTNLKDRPEIKITGSLEAKKE